MYDIYAQIAYSLKGADVDTVIIGGRTVMLDRKLLTINEKQVLEKAREYGKSVKKSLEMQDWRLSAACRKRVAARPFWQSHLPAPL